MLYEQLVHEILRGLHLEVGIDVNEDTIPKLCEMIKKRMEKANPIDAMVIPHTCGHCKYWSSETYKCNCPVLFPDSTYSRSSGFRREMRNDDGQNCPTYKAV